MTAEAYPCSWCGKHTSHQIVEKQFFTPPWLWRHFCGTSCREQWYADRIKLTEHVDPWGYVS